MTTVLAPNRCRLCNQMYSVTTAGFRQVYRQLALPSVELSWWECRSCSGWFVYPVPSPEVIVRNCVKAFYNDPTRAAEIAQAKEAIQKRILARASEWTAPGPLLDFGCSFGEFLVLAREAGWTACGFDPNETAVMDARKKGFDVRFGWALEEAGYPEKHFAAITVNDSFCFAWHPFETLQHFNRLLQSKGVLAMRITNKRHVLGLVRSVFPRGAERDARLSRILQGQFHSISLGSLIATLRSIGFDRIEVESQAMTAPWRILSTSTRLAYGAARVVSLLTVSKINLSPGVLLFAQKSS